MKFLSLLWMILITINKSYIVTYVNKESWYCLDIRSNTEVERYISENIFLRNIFFFVSYELFRYYLHREYDRGSTFLSPCQSWNVKVSPGKSFGQRSQVNFWRVLIILRAPRVNFQEGPLSISQYFLYLNTGSSIPEKIERLKK